MKLKIFTMLLLTIMLSASCYPSAKTKTGLKDEVLEVEESRESMEITEMQITFEPKNHDLDNNDNFSLDDRWLVYDTRCEDGIGANPSIEKVNVQSGETVVLYEAPNQTEYGPGVGAASFSPVENKVVFIHGLMNCNAERPYCQWRRTAVAVDESQPRKPIFMDARDVTAPFTPGALRGGTHRHEWSADGQWIGFTYNDAIMAAIEKRTGESVNLRTIGVATSLGAVKVDNDAEGENNDGLWFSALVVKVVPKPRPNSDEISRAFNDSWIGTKGYRKPNGTWQRARAFLGNVHNKQGEKVAEVFVVDIPDRIDIPDNEGPLEGTENSFPVPPKGAKQRRLTRTAKSKYPGCSMIVRSSPDGNHISYLAKDDNGIAQVFFISPLCRKPVQVTYHVSPVQSGVRWNPNGKEICYVCDNSIYICDVRDGTSFGRTERMTTKTDEPPVCPVWSYDGNTIGFNRYVYNSQEAHTQIFLLKL